MTRPSRLRTLVVSSIVVGSLTLGIFAIAPPARAQDHDHAFAAPMAPSVELHAGFSWWGVGLAAGGRFRIPFAYGWFSRSVVQTFSFTVGADFYFMREEQDDVYSAAFGIPLTVEYRIHLGPRWALLAELGVNVFVAHAWIADSRFEYPGAWFIGTVGLAYYFTPGISLVARLGTPYSSLGIAFAF